MKNIILLLLLSLVSNGVIHAQTTKQKAAPVKQQPQKKDLNPKEQPTQRGKEKTDRMNSICGLQAEQIAKLNALFADYYTKHDALKKQKNVLAKKVYEDKVKALKKSKDQKIMSILTADQLKKWEIYKVNGGKDGKEQE